MSKVFVVDTQYRPLDSVHPGYARLLLSSGRAAVYRRYPFTIILNTAVQQPVTQPLRLKLDPGSRTTGIAVVNDASGEVVWAAELEHRGHIIKKRLDARRAIRRSRRQRKTRYRQPRFDNRRRKQGWLPPSLASRIATSETWVHRLRRYCPITAIALELVKFDTQAIQHPEIAGVEYQQGALHGYEVREYLLEKWGRTCAYCGANDVPLQVEHIHACATGGTNRVSNLTLACEPCNMSKGTQNVRDFLKHKPDVLKRILARATAPLKDASAVNATRWALYERLIATGLPVECGTGGRTKFNRTMQGLAKAHWSDAACVGASTPLLVGADQVVPLLIKATGHGTRQMCGTDKYGFPLRHRMRQKRSYGFQTGDMVRAVVTTGSRQGVYTGRVLVRATGSFDLAREHERLQGISHRFCSTLHRCDGYSYQKGTAAIPPRARSGGASLPLSL